MNETGLEKIRQQLAAARFLPHEITAWIRECQRGNTVLSNSGAMGHLLDRSISIYSYHAAQARHWAIQDGCAPTTPHAEMWTPQRVRLFPPNHYRQDGNRAKPAHTRIVLVSNERFMRVLAPDVHTRYILDEINALPRLTDAQAKQERMQERDALWDCGLGYINGGRTWTIKRAHTDVTLRTGTQIAALSDWAFRLQLFTDIELWLDQAPPVHYPRPCLTRRLGRLYVEFPYDDTSDKAAPPSQPVSDRLAMVLLDYIKGPRERLRGAYAGRALWVSAKGGPLGANGTYKQIVAKTEAAFGLAVNPHLFRDCHATSASRSDPQSAPVAHLLLGNSMSVTRSVYDHSNSREAGLIIANFSDELIKRSLKTPAIR